MSLLASCYRSCFALAEQHEIRTIAFPSISTGAYGFPMDRAARIAVRETKQFLERNTIGRKVLLVCFGQQRLRDSFASAAAKPFIRSFRSPASTMFNKLLLFQP